MLGPRAENTAAPPDADSAIVADVEELIAAVGLRAFVRACMLSSAGESFTTYDNGALRIAQALLRDIVFSKTPQLEAEIMALGAGILLGKSQSITAVARKHGITKSAVSKRVVAFCDRNGLPPSPFMKSKRARAVYALTNKPRTA